MIRTLALYLNFFCPGLGSLVLGKWLSGLIQLAVLAGSIYAFSYSFHASYAVIAIAADWIWGLFSAEWSPRTGRVERR